MITGADMWRIAHRFQIAPEQFLALCNTSVTTEDSFTLGGPDRFRIALQKQGSGEVPLEQRWCAFWMAFSESDGRCAAYDARPRACQVYPAFRRDGIVHLRADALCAPRSWSLATADLPSWQRALARYAMEEDFYCAVVRAWNRSVEAALDGKLATPVVYYAYLMAVYDRVEQICTELGDGEWGAMCAKWGDWLACNGKPLDPQFTPEPRWRETIEALRQTIADAQPINAATH